MNNSSWDLEFCTVCDKQCPAGGVYCSKKCRMEDTRNDKLDSVESLAPLTYSQTDTSATYGESQDSGEEDSEVPSLCLTTPYKTILCRKHRKLKRDSQFLYLSPTLKPVKPKTGVSPDMSPLLMPQTQVTSETHAMSQSVNSYRQWLADRA